MWDALRGYRLVLATIFAVTGTITALHRLGVI
jgi:hypothetical protein